MSRLPKPKSAARDVEAYAQLLAIVALIVWLFGSAKAAQVEDAALFSAMGSVGLVAVALYVWMQRAILSRVQAQIEANRIHSIAHLRIAIGFFPLTEKEDAIHAANEAAQYAKWLSETYGRVSVREVAVAATATLQWAFGDRALNKFILCGEWQCP